MPANTAKEPVREGLKLVPKGEAVDLAKLSVLEDDLKRRLKVIQTARRCADVLPLDVKERVEAKDALASLNDIAVLYANVPSFILNEMEFSTLKLLEMVGGLVEDYSSSEWISIEDLEIVVNFIRFLTKLQPRSKRQFRQFFECALEGDIAVALMTNKGTKAEVKFSFEESE